MYKLIANGLFFSCRLFFLPTKNLCNSLFISVSLISLSLKSDINPANSSNEFGLDRIEAGELLSNSPSGAQYAFAIPPNLAGNDNVLT